MKSIIEEIEFATWPISDLRITKCGSLLEEPLIVLSR